MFAIFSVVRQHPCRPAAIPIQRGVLCPTADVNKNASQFQRSKASSKALS